LSTISFWLLLSFRIALFCLSVSTFAKCRWLICLYRLSHFSFSIYPRFFLGLVENARSF
jgi:hypothetical protein